jgi:hypothetical protein
MKKLYAIAILCAALLPLPMFGQSGIIPSGRYIDWSRATKGIPGGIPARTTICSTLSSGASNAAIQSALNACPSGQTVKLGAGSYNITLINMPSNVTLRGSGPQSTVLHLTSSGTTPFQFGGNPRSYPDIATSVNITSGATAGSTSFVVSNASNIAVGGYLMITELNDPALNVTSQGSDGNCTYCDTYPSGGVRVRGQIVEVTGRSGTNNTTIAFTPALYSAYTLTPQATPFTAGTVWAGIEDLQVYAQNTGYHTNFSMDEVAYCWIKNVESNYADGDHVDLNYAFRVEVRDSYFTDGFSHGAGQTDDDVLLGYKTSESLIENNILERMHSAIFTNFGAAGNVVDYNYSVGGFDSGATSVVTIDIDMHGAHPQYNLFEGNTVVHIWPDEFHGSSGTNTYFRNWAKATTHIAPPYTGRSPVQWSSYHLATQQNRGITQSYLVTNNNLVGNIEGSAEATQAVNGTGNLFNTGSGACTSCRVAPGTRNYEGTFYARDFGYQTGSDTSGGGVPGPWVGLSFTTSLIHGEYDTAQHTTIWDLHCPTTCSHTLPDSFIYASKPSWFGSNHYPAIGPDVTGGIDVDGHVYDIPAVTCYNNTPKDSGGQLQFNAAACYVPPTGQDASLSPTLVPFGNQTINTTSSTRTTTLTNVGDSALHITSISITGTDAAKFSQSNTCGSTLVAAASCTVSVTFTPTTTTSHTAAVSVASDAISGSPTIASLTGLGVAVAPTGTPGPSILTVSLPAASVGVPFNTQLSGSCWTASGGVLTQSACLWDYSPKAVWLAISPAGALSGVPTAATTLALNVTATDPAGQKASRSLSLVVTPPSPTCPAPPTGSWAGCYYLNVFGSLLLGRIDPAINFDWGSGSPDPVVPNDGFSIRWKGNFNLSAGSYTFTGSVDDGLRLYIDGSICIDKWFDQPMTTYTCQKTLAAGVHSLQADYYENGGGANVKVSWVNNTPAALLPKPICSATSTRMSCSTDITSLPSGSSITDTVTSGSASSTATVNKP